MKKLFLIANIVCIIFTSCKKNTTEPPESVTVTTFAGSGIDGFADGNGTASKFSGPRGIATDAQGNICVADSHEPRIRKITPAAMVTTLAGNGRLGYVDGSNGVAQFTDPNDLATDAQGNVYVTESNRIRKITSTGEVSTLTSGISGHADGDLSTAQFGTLQGITIDPSGNIYVIDWDGTFPYWGAIIRKITTGGIVTTLAGNIIPGYKDGNGNVAQFLNPYGIASDTQGNIYVADYGNRRVRKITPAGVASSISEFGGAIDGPKDVAADRNGNIYVIQNSTIYKVSSSGGSAQLIAGSNQGYADGRGSTALFKALEGIALDALGNIYVSDYWDNRIRKITIK
jgi:NHL repeat